MSLTQLLYVSTIAPGVSPDNVMAIHAQSQRKNAERDVTGLLLYGRGNFMQLLEGDGAVVTAFVKDLLTPLIALFVLANNVVGFGMHQIPRENPNVLIAYNLHKSIGLTVLVLSLARLAWRHEAEKLRTESDSYVLHEHLEEENHAV